MQAYTDLTRYYRPVHKHYPKIIADFNNFLSTLALLNSTLKDVMLTGVILMSLAKLNIISSLM